MDVKLFQNIKKWIDDVWVECGNDVIIVFVGNKIDFNDKCEVMIQQGEDEVKKNNFMFVEMSVKVGYNVKNLFKRIVQVLLGMEGLDIVVQVLNQSKWNGSMRGCLQYVDMGVQ